MNPANQIWIRLTAAARRAPVESRADESAPAGFATRVVALTWSNGSASTSALFERLGLRALACAFAVMVVSAMWSIAPTATAASSNDERSLDMIDPVGEVLQIVQNS